MRAALVRQETLVQIADHLELSRHLILGVGERKGGGRHRASILADAVEALIAAVYLDNLNSDGENIIHRMVMDWYKRSDSRGRSRTGTQRCQISSTGATSGQSLPLPT